jgi:hypothetical protein
MTELLVGTDRGLYVVDESGDTWTVAAHFLNGMEVNNVVRETSGTILASSREAGLVRIDVDRGTVTPLGAGTLPPAVRSIAVSPADPDVIYAGTEPAGIFCSRDRGATWHEDAQVAKLREARKWQYPGKIESHIRNITIDRDDPQCIYAAVQIGGLLRTEDGGAHWEDVTVDIDPDVHTIMQHPTDSRILFAVCGGGGEYPHPTPEHRTKPPYPHGRPLYKSLDRGKTWKSISDGIPQSYGIPIAAAGGARPVLLAGVARGVPPRWVGRPEKADSALIISEDEGATWVPVADGLPAPFHSMVEAIEVDARRQRVYIGTSGDGRDWGPVPDLTPCPGAMYYSREGTRGWTQVPLELPQIQTISAG